MSDSSYAMLAGLSAIPVIIPFVNFGAQVYVAFSSNVEYDFEV